MYKSGFKASHTYVCVNLCCFTAFVSEQLLNMSQAVQCKVMIFIYFTQIFVKNFFKACFATDHYSF